MAYASDSVALAAMELLTYWGRYGSVRGYRLFAITFRESDVEDVVDMAGDLDPHDLVQTRAYGDGWARAGRSVTLRVPSVVVALSDNYVINPNHPRFTNVATQELGDFAYDDRIVSLVERAP